VIFDTLTNLPEWFGIPESILEFAEKGSDLPVYGYEDNSRIVGFVCIKETSECAADIYVLGILKEYHRKGIGRQFVKICEQYCIDRGLKLLQVKTLDNHVGYEYYLRTWEFYKAMGFLPLEVLPLWDELNPCLIMVKPINTNN
jgi:ribosomal protein S18 acetylase RimI-like enzyme